MRTLLHGCDPTYLHLACPACEEWQYQCEVCGTDTTLEDTIREHINSYHRAIIITMVHYITLHYTTLYCTVM